MIVGLSRNQNSTTIRKEIFKTGEFILSSLVTFLKAFIT